MTIEVDRFLSAEARLLAETGTIVHTRTLMVSDPAAMVRRVRVLEAGPEGAPPVVMIHGGNSVAAGWEPLLSLLREDVHLFAPDRPGCGLTDMVDYHGARFREHAVAFVGSVLDGLNLGRASLVGNSIGGYWALLYALAHPERVERVALVGESAGSPPRPVLRYRLISTPGLNRLLYATVLKPSRQRARQQLKMLVAHPERVSEAFLDMSDAAANLPGARLAWLSMLERVWPLGGAPELTYALRPELGRIQCPVLFVWGDHDFCPPRWGQELCEIIPGARIEVLPGAGHLAWLDSPRAVAELLGTFLQEGVQHGAQAERAKTVSASNA